MSTFIKDLRDRLEGLLACRVPYLQLHVDVLHSHEQASEFDAHRHFMIFSKLIVAHAMHQTRLADATVTYHNQLEQLVLLQRGRSTALGRYDLISKLLNWRSFYLIDFFCFFRRKDLATFYNRPELMLNMG